MRQTLPTLSALLASSMLAAHAFCQSGTYAPFGIGCPGTGAGGQAPGIVLPAAFTAQWGPVQNVYGVGQAHLRYQQVFLESEIGSTKTFFGYALRENERVVQLKPGGTVSYTILLGYTTLGPNSMTSTFASNFNTSRGAPAQVFQGNVNLPSMPGTNTNLSNFAFELKFAAPFVFTQVAGENLLIEQQATHTTTVYQWLDAVSSGNTARVYNTASSDASTGTVEAGYGLVFKLLTAQHGGVIPEIANTGLPEIGKTFLIHLSKARAMTAAALTTGASNKSWGAFVLPLDLAAIGAAGCSLLASPDFSTPFPVDANGTAMAFLRIPNVAALRGVMFHNQWIVFDPGANALGFSFSNAGTAQIGG